MKNNESLFKARYPDIFSRYKLYQRYYLLKTGRDFMEAKDYDSVLVKSLTVYFLYYREKLYDKTITLKSVAELFNYRDHTGVVYAIKRIRMVLLKQSKYRIKDKYIKEYFLVFNGIFQKQKSNDRILNRNNR